MLNKTFALSAISIAYTAALLIYSALPMPAAGAGPAPPSGWLVHFVAYAVYAALLLATFSRITPARKAAISSIVVAAAVGALAEFMQLYCPGRVCDTMDWLVDVAGALAGLVLIILLKRATRRKE
ncbi:MAG: VanZ family protein [Candidatus Aenigmarchaeota archaeon]|nr:VanZ family protein [Candidatus Aenigmarchaeota archaeon]